MASTVSWVISLFRLLIVYMRCHGNNFVTSSSISVKKIEVIPLGAGGRAIGNDKSPDCHVIGERIQPIGDDTRHFSVIFCLLRTPLTSWKVSPTNICQSLQGYEDQFAPEYVVA